MHRSSYRAVSHLSAMKKAYPNLACSVQVSSNALHCVIHPPLVTSTVHSNGVLVPAYEPLKIFKHAFLISPRCMDCQETNGLLPSPVLQPVPHLADVTVVPCAMSAASLLSSFAASDSLYTSRLSPLSTWLGNFWQSKKLQSSELVLVVLQLPYTSSVLA